jgi:Fic family protein
MSNHDRQKTMETPHRVEPCQLDTIPGPLADLVAELVAKATRMAGLLHPATATSLAKLLRLANCYYSNLIEGHVTRPRDIERALAEDLDTDRRRRDLQREARAHVRVQREIDERFARGELGEPASVEMIQWIHREFYRDAPASMLTVERTRGASFRMEPGALRSRKEHDNAVGRHQPPLSEFVVRFMAHFERRFALSGMGTAARIVAIPIAHHRLNYIHPFPDGNGRASRLMSHAMALQAGIGAHGLWSVSRGLARGLPGRPSYQDMMDHADAPRAGAVDGRGSLSLRALVEFAGWFCEVMLDQVAFMSSMLEIDGLQERIVKHVQGDLGMGKAEAAIARDVALRGEVARGEAARITGLSERAARDALGRLQGAGLLASATPKGPVSLRVSTTAAEALFPRLF